jgi:hypothetical protein
VTAVPIDAPRSIALRFRSCAASGVPPGSVAVGVAQPDSLAAIWSGMCNVIPRAFHWSRLACHFSSVS